MQNYHRATRTQAEPKPGQILNEAGGAAYLADKWDRLERFLLLGVTGSTFYAGQRELTLQNLDVVGECIDEDAERAAQMAADISTAGRAKSNDPALYVLARARSAGLRHVSAVARTGTHILHFVNYASAFGGWGRAFKRTVAQWFTSRGVDVLAYQMLKYRQRDGWSMRNLLRLSHPKPRTPAYDALFRWACGYPVENLEALPDQIRGYELAAKASSAELPGLIERYKLTREMVPTEALRSPDVWRALQLPYIAVVRNLSNMIEAGACAPFSDALK